MINPDRIQALTKGNLKVTLFLVESIAVYITDRPSLLVFERGYSQ